MAGAAPPGLLHGGVPRLFRPAAVAAELFPARLWARLAARGWRRDGAAMVPYGDPMGYRPLREQIADHLVRHRAVLCTADEVMITAGSQHALNHLVQLLLDEGDPVALEDPAYLGFLAAARAGGAVPIPVPVDAAGIDVSGLDADTDRVRMVYTTPSHQYPLGVTLSLERRLRLLEWAGSTGAWVIEDDYDSEFRYESRPLPALQGLDREGRVIYVGTFSKVLAPALRIGFIVLPPPLIQPFRSAMAVSVYHPPTALQATLSEFMAEGHLERHILRLRAVYGDRWRALRTALDDVLGTRVDVLPGAAGLHLTVSLPRGMDDRALSRLASEHALDVPPLSHFYLGNNPRPGVILGFGGWPPGALRAGVATLAELLDRLEPPSNP